VTTLPATVLWARKRRTKAFIRPQIAVLFLFEHFGAAVDAGRYTNEQYAEKQMVLD